MHLEFRNIPRRTLYWSLAILLVFIVLLALPISLSRTINVAGKVLPARAWLLVKNQQGSVLATFSDNLRGNVGNYTAVNVIRGDAFGFTLRTSLKPGDTVVAGDTVVSIRSHELVRQSEQIGGELAVAKANLAVMLSGEKEPITREAEKSLVLAKERSQLQDALFKRQDSLYQKNLVSREVYDLARSAAQMAAIEVAIAEARLQTVSTGSKPEQIRMIQSQIAALERDLRMLAEQVGAMTLVAPLTGILLASPSVDTLCILEDTARVALVAVPVEYMTRVLPGQSMTLRVPRRPETVPGVVVRVDPQVHLFMGKQVVMATAALHDTRGVLPSHLVMIGAIETERVSPVRLLGYWVTDLWNEVLGATTGT